MPGAGEGDVGQGVGVKGGVALLDDGEHESTTQSPGLEPNDFLL